MRAPFARPAAPTLDLAASQLTRTLKWRPETCYLLLSASDRAPKGVANASDQVGRNLMDHLQGSSQARANEPLFPFRGPPTTAGIDAFRDGQFRRERAAFRMSLGNDGWARSGSPWSDVVDAVKKEKRFGDDLIKQLQYRVTHQFRISYSTEMLPDPTTASSWTHSSTPPASAAPKSPSRERPSTTSSLSLKRGP